MNPVSINYLAVIVCAIISMVLGALWYGPLFGKEWMKQIGVTEDDLKKDFNPAKTYSLAVAAHFFVALIVSYFIDLFHATTVVDGLRIALTAWIGFVAAPMYVNFLFERRSIKLLIINSGYNLVLIIIFGIILVTWQ
ncbi:MAG: hypothetical protein CO129_09155 [Ignavibacteriales bacterium CG_4_9_14_3_um_filter_34_10]|nr:MAG: hypothetical protein CO129_09155 [Ignavibacteriales bacterium CG_4_9_14_3_um_filter_34_10]